MGNKHSISDDIINALMHAGVNPSDFHKFDAAKTGKLEASEILKLVRDKAFRLRKYAKLLDTVGMQECKTIVSLVDRNSDSSIDFNEFSYAMSLLQEGYLSRRANQLQVAKQVEEERKKRIEENKRFGSVRSSSRAAARKFEKGIMIRDANFGVSPKEMRRYKNVRAENQRRATVEAEKERGRRISEREWRQRSRHAAARILARHKLKNQRVGLSPKQRKGLSPVQVRKRNQQLVADATEHERKERAESFHFQKHMTTVASEAIQNHWAQNTTLSPKEKRGLTEDEIRAETQRRVIHAMEIEKKARVRELMRMDAEAEEARIVNQSLARDAANKEQTRRIIEIRREEEAVAAERRRRQKEAAEASATEQARRSHAWRQHDVHAHMQRRINQRRASESLDDEQARRTHAWLNASVVTAIERRANQKKAIDAMEHERARRIHEHLTGDVHSDLLRAYNKRKAVEAIESERARRVHEASVNDVHAGLRRKMNQSRVGKEMLAEQKRRLENMRHFRKLTPKQEAAMIRKIQEKKAAAAAASRDKKTAEPVKKPAKKSLFGGFGW